jgi:hypothetical protein
MAQSIRSTGVWHHGTSLKNLREVVVKLPLFSLHVADGLFSSGQKYFVATSRRFTFPRNDGSKTPRTILLGESYFEER